MHLHRHVCLLSANFQTHKHSHYTLFHLLFTIYFKTSPPPQVPQRERPIDHSLTLTESILAKSKKVIRNGNSTCFQMSPHPARPSRQLLLEAFVTSIWQMLWQSKALCPRALPQPARLPARYPHCWAHLCDKPPPTPHILRACTDSNKTLDPPQDLPVCRSYNLQPQWLSTAPHQLAKSPQPRWGTDSKVAKPFPMQTAD